MLPVFSIGTDVRLPRLIEALAGLTAGLRQLGLFNLALPLRQAPLFQPRLAQFGRLANRSPPRLSACAEPASMHPLQSPQTGTPSSLSHQAATCPLARALKVHLPLPPGGCHERNASCCANAQGSSSPPPSSVEES